MATRSAEDVAAGILRIAVGGQERLVPTLSIKDTREWQMGLATGPSGFTVPVTEDDWTAATVAEFTGLTLEAVLDVVVAYDKTGALGGREWLETHADPAQVYAAASQMAEVAFPFATDIPMVLAALVVRNVVGSASPSSTSGPSRTGASTRARSKRASTRAS